jgi:hypothetical protein
MAFFPDWFKELCIACPWVFETFQGVVRVLVVSVQVLSQAYDFLSDLWDRLPRWLLPERFRTILHDYLAFRLVTAIVKYVPRREGEYVFGDVDNIGGRASLRLPLFEDEQDVQVAQESVADCMQLLDRVGRMSPWTRAVHAIGINFPYDPAGVKAYVDACRKRFLLTEQHLAGGCQDAVDASGKYDKAANIYVADLSSISLPRISPQMTAYLMGFHVATQMG